MTGDPLDRLERTLDEGEYIGARSGVFDTAEVRALVEVARAARSLLDVADDGDYDLPLVANDVRAALARLDGPR